MKLNVGCGYTYLQGHLNVDASEDSLADALMEAHDLQLKTASIDEISASQIIEHLGFFKGKYFLAECFRVLRPGGTLRLETPHLENSFEIFLAGDRRARESALTWLYGAETAGMQHRFCFPLELLREIAAETGFDLLGQESFCYQENRPSLRLLLQKPAAGEKNEFMAELRKRLVVRGIPAFDDELAMAGQEELLLRLADLVRGDPAEILQLAVCSAEIVREFFALMGEAGAGKYHAVAAQLAEGRFQAVLLAMLKARREGGGQQGAAFRGAVREGIAIIADLLGGVKVTLLDAEEQTVRVFSEPVLKSLADKLFARGLKEFGRAEYGKAVGSFEQAALIFRNNPFIYWNLARLHNLRHNSESSRLNYQRAESALEACALEVKRAHRETLKAEMRSASPREPVIATLPLPA